jgi:hypothetical protein
LADGIVLERVGIPAVSIGDVHIVVAGAPNAGVSSIVETFGSVNRPPSVVTIEEKPEMS